MPVGGAEDKRRERVILARFVELAGGGLEIDPEHIREGLRTSSASFFQTPGRLNLIEGRAGRVLIDYCHDLAGLTALADFIGRLGAARTVAMIAMPGDRRDEDIAAFGALAGHLFDEVIVREDRRPRRRACAVDGQ